jgi:hypothetical protein
MYSSRVLTIPLGFFVRSDVCTHVNNEIIEMSFYYFLASSVSTSFEMEKTHRIYSTTYSIQTFEPFLLNKNSVAFGKSRLNVLIEIVPSGSTGTPIIISPSSMFTIDIFELYLKGKYFSD